MDQGSIPCCSTKKSGPSSDCGLQPAHMKLELLVIADQHAAVNTFPGLVENEWNIRRRGGFDRSEESPGLTEHGNC